MLKQLLHSDASAHDHPAHMDIWKWIALAQLTAEYPLALELFLQSSDLPVAAFARLPGTAWRGHAWLEGRLGST